MEGEFAGEFGHFDIDAGVDFAGEVGAEHLAVGFKLAAGDFHVLLAVELALCAGGADRPGEEADAHALPG